MENKNVRKAISVKLRFEVFKRDNFTCQYCGRKSPDVILHVDHIDPVKNGGDIHKIKTDHQKINQTIVAQSTAIGFDTSSVFEETVSGYLNPYFSI